MVGIFQAGAAAAATTRAAAAAGAAGCHIGWIPLTARQPGVDEHILGGEAIRRLFAQQAADKTLGPGAEGLGQRELTLADFGKQAKVLRTVERIPKQAEI